MPIWLRLFELYSEKHSVLVQAENEYKVKAFEKKDKKKYLDKIVKLRKKTLKNLLNLASRLSKKVKDPKVLTKIYYFEGLNYYLVGNEKAFHSKLKLAEKYAKKIKMKRQIFSRLADYYYNKNKYQLAQEYYIKTIRLKKDKWYPKYLYNLAWTYYTTGDVKRAANYVNLSYNYSKKKGYVDYSDQSVDTLLLFYANSDRVTLGIKFLVERKEKTFDQLLKFLDYVFEHSTKKYAVLVLKEFEDLKLTEEQEVTLLSREMKVYRGLKRYPELQERLKRFAGLKLTFEKVAKLSKEQLVVDIKVYTGLLQSMVKNFPDKRKGVYSNYIIENFELLIQIDGKNSIDYEFYSGETFFAINNHDEAIKYYKRALVRYKKAQNPNPALATKVYDSYFKSLEYLKKRPNYTDMLIESFESYLSSFPNGKRAKLIYESMIAQYLSKKDYSNTLKSVVRYNKAYPKEKKLQQGYINKLINIFTDKRDHGAMGTLEKYLMNPSFAFSAADKLKFKNILFQLEFQDSVDLLKAEETREKGITQLYKIFKNETYTRAIRTAAIVSILKFYYDNNQMKNLAKRLTDFQNFLTQAELNKETEKIIFYTSRFCEKIMIEECLANMSFIRTKTPHLFDQAFEENQFKFLLINDKFGEAYSLVRDNKQRASFFKQFLLTSSIDNLIKFLTTSDGQKFQNEMIPELEEVSLKLFMNSVFGIDSGALDKYKRIGYVKEKLISYKREFADLKKTISKPKVSPPVPADEKGQVSFEEFSKFLDSFVAEFQSMNNEYNSLIQNKPPYYALYIIREFYNNYESVIRKYSNYIPQTNEQELKNAILGEMAKLIDVLKQKKKELVSVRIKSSLTGANFSGSNYFNYLSEEKPPLKSNLDNFLLWKE